MKLKLLPSVAGVLGLGIGSGDAAVVDMSFELTTGSVTVHVHVCVKGVCVFMSLYSCVTVCT